MNSLLSILYLVSSITVISLGVMVYLNNRKSRVNVSFFAFCLSLFFWLFFAFLGIISDDYYTSLLFYKICFVGITFIPSTFYHFAYVFVGGTSRRRIAGLYILSALFAASLLSPEHLIRGLFLFPWGFYPAAGRLLHAPFLLFCISSLFSALRLLYRELKKDDISSIQRVKLKYIFAGLLVASLASVDFLGNYGIQVIPLGSVFMSLFTFILTYATLRHHLLDIRVAFARFLLLFITTVIVIGIPLLFGMKLLGIGLWIIPVSSATILASSAPLLYIYLKERTEGLLLKQQRRYQQTLLFASLGMLYKRELDRLLRFVVILLTLVARLRYAAIYLFNEELGCFELKAERPLLQNGPLTLEKDNPLVVRVLSKNILNRDDFLTRGKEHAVAEEMERLKAAIVVPCSTGRGIIGFLVFGGKRSGQHFTSDEIDTFLTLSNQFALAIENALYLKDLEKTRSELFHAAKMSSLGAMASGLAHQINNRLHTILLTVESLSALYDERLNHRGRELVERVVRNIRQAEETIEKLRHYAKTSTEKTVPLSLRGTVESAVEMMRLKREAFGRIRLEIDIDAGLKVSGNPSQLREVFFNLLDNADNAVSQALARGEEFDPLISVRARPSGQGEVEVFVEDNGVGIRESLAGAPFVPFQTTRASSSGGAGLGLFIVEKIVELHKGSLKVEPAEGRGTRIVIRLKGVQDGRDGGEGDPQKNLRML